MERVREIRGSWCFPALHESLWLSGTLIITPDNEMELDISDFFRGSEEEMQKYREMLSAEVVYGSSHDGEPIILYHCYKKFDQLSLPSHYITASFYVETALIGADFSRKEEIRFKKISVAYHYLDNWLGISGIKLEETSNPYESFKVRYEAPAPIDIYPKIGIKVRLEVLPRITMGEIPKKEVCIKEKVYLIVEAPGGLSLEEISRYVFLFQNLFSLLISEPTYPDKIYASGENGFSPADVEIVFPRTVRRQELFYAGVALYPYFRIKDKLKCILENWLEKSEELEPIFNLYFGVIYNSDVYIEHEFLSFIMALEAYHRRKSRNEEVPQEEHRKRVERILEASPEEYKKWLEEKLKYSNEPSLRKRLKEIFDSLADVEYITQLIPDKKRFIEEVVSTRNYFIHYDRSLKSKALEGKALLRAGQKLKIIIEICLLKKAGFSSEEVDEAVLNSWKHRHMLTDQSRN
ncbi:HEPN domain-containing protein [Thermoanaerobacter thermohydrosulfuricus]